MGWFISSAVLTIISFCDDLLITCVAILLMAALLFVVYNKKGLKAMLTLVVIMIVVAGRFIYLDYQKAQWHMIRDQTDTLTIKVVKTIDGNKGKIIGSENFDVNRGFVNIFLEDDFDSGTIIEHTGELAVSKKYNNFFVPYEYCYINDYVGYITEFTGDIKVKKSNPLLHHRLNDAIIKRVENILDNLSDSSAGLVQGIFFGSKSNLSNTDRYSLLNAGLVHLTAVSGFHIGIIYYLIFSISNVIIKNKDRCYLLGLLFTTLFVIFVGVKASTLRALIMIAIFTTSKVLGYPYSLTRSIGITFMLSIIVNPFLIYDMGFQFSYLGVLGIAIFHSRINFLNWIPNDFLANILKATIAVQITTFPLNIYYNGGFPLLSPLSNLLTTPVMPFIFLSVLVGIMIPITPVFIIIEILAKWILFVANIYGTWIPISLSFMLYIISIVAIFYLSYKYSKIQTSSIVLAIILTIMYYSSIYIPTVYLHFIDVGQGDCILITDNNYNVLVDTGGNINYDVGNRAVIPTLKRLGVTKLDYVFITHAHFDHGGAIAEIADEIPIENIVIPNNQFFKGYTADLIYNTAEKKQINIIEIEKGAKSTFSDDFKLKTLHPTEDFFPTESPINNISLVFEGRLFEKEILLTGDIEKQGESKVAPHLNEIDILKVGHHGSSTSTTQEIIENSSPQYAIITVGENSFGHPSADVVKRLEDSGAKVFRTDKDGRIYFRIRPWGYKVETTVR
ncbi:DNA internalization-related competence protein ComEC/Rec2 [Proteinivorax tanatarense]|uniref:DNA internalization-related competence protein ComEC/Rec2 n=1 Tax=Proteinivorax tanatarense TaxID=1260629 RepID=A0AAU7VIT1_9FIRM